MNGAQPIPPYQPMTFGQILERVFRLLRTHFRLLIGVAVIPGLVFLVSYGVLFAIWGREIISGVRSSNPEDIFRLVRLVSAISVPLMLMYLAVFALYLAAASYAAVLADRGTSVSIGEAYRVAWTRMGHYLLLVLAIYAVTFLPALLLELPIFVSMTAFGANKPAPNPVLLLFLPIEFLLVFAAAVTGAIIALRLSLAFPASVFEVLKVRDAIQRSWTLTRGALGRIFLVVLVIYAAIYAATMVLIFAALSVGAIALIFAGTPSDSKYAFILPVVFGVVVYIALIALCTVGTWSGFTTAFAVIYNDQRSRVHGSLPSPAVSGVPG